MPVEAYRLLDLSHRLATGATPAERPFVDRTGEMALLQNLVPAISEGRGRVVGLVGEAGIGKSRLVGEFRKRLAGNNVSGHLCLAGSWPGQARSVWGEALRSARRYRRNRWTHLSISMEAL